MKEAIEGNIGALQQKKLMTSTFVPDDVVIMSEQCLHDLFPGAIKAAENVTVSRFCPLHKAGEKCAWGEFFTYSKNVGHSYAICKTDACQNAR